MLRLSALALLLACAAASAADVEIGLTGLDRNGPPSAVLNLQLWIYNHGPEAVTLVRPGDGSLQGLRTPIVTFTWKQDGKVVPHAVPPHDAAIKPLNAGDVFTLKAHESISFTDWIVTHPPSEGNFRLTATYSNDPTLVWRGKSAQHSESEMEKVRRSNPVSAESHRLYVTRTAAGITTMAPDGPVAPRMPLPAALQNLIPAQK